ncbi:MAG: bifunctional phosphoribosylaminoimidazolecarboxamide formyltransferase/IMP cyclohydrolase, partial [Planctomycetaceae bacterium]|nr:bifunctional phosphoribosylaminoimidazolecarboxamide formyltransferase/IMP cyclohydrolase [Planctomycetaceae bacterium]
TSAKQYPDILADIASGGLSTALRRRLAQEAFALTSEYDAAIAAYLSSADGEGDARDELPATKSLQLTRQRSLRYGENPHQRAAVYVEGAAPAGSLLAAEVLHGKELSYNNLLDLDAALAVVQGLPGPAVSVIKHNNPCGAATSARLADATLEALDGDPLSAFGSIVAFNRP